MTVEIPANVYGLTDKFEKIKIADTVVTAETVNGTISSIDNTADGVYQFFDVDGTPIYNVQVGDRPYACRTIVPGSKEKYHIQPDPDPVGGTIFYIDNTADGTYEFFDADGNIIKNVQVGDRPYAYRVIAPGTKDKYYVYHDELYEGRWTYYKNGSYVYESDKSIGLVNNVDEIIGTGKTNTEAVMVKDNGAYITADANGHPTIWYQLQQVRNAKTGGCDDWFVPCLIECNRLRGAIESGSITGGIIAGSSYDTSVFRKDFWSSSVYGGYASSWYHSDDMWSNIYGKETALSVFFTRAF